MTSGISLLISNREGFDALDRVLAEADAATAGLGRVLAEADAATAAIYSLARGGAWAGTPIAAIDLITTLARGRGAINGLDCVDATARDPMFCALWGGLLNPAREGSSAQP